KPGNAPPTSPRAAGSPRPSAPATPTPTACPADARTEAPRSHAAGTRRPKRPATQASTATLTTAPSRRAPVPLEHVTERRHRMQRRRRVLPVIAQQREHANRYGIEDQASAERLQPYQSAAAQNTGQRAQQHHHR